jgi:hypothetical protein
MGPETKTDLADESQQQFTAKNGLGKVTRKSNMFKE